MRNDRHDEEIARTEEEIEQAAMNLVNESRRTYIPSPHVFNLFSGKEEAIQELIQALEMAKEKNQFTGIILYGKSKDKIALAEAAASYLGCHYYDLITDDAEEEDDLDKETSQAFSRKFVQLLAEDIQKRDKAVVCWVDQTDDFYKEMTDWEKEMEEEFTKTILQLKNVIAINIIESPELITTDFYQPADYQFKIKVDDEYKF